MNNTKDMDWDTFGPGDQYKINTNEWFHVKIEFVEEFGMFQKYLTTLSQGNEVTTHGNCAYNNGLTDDLRDGMAFAITSWSTYDDWLWGDKCQAGSCSNRSL
jgi:hypothetical protein